MELARWRGNFYLLMEALVAVVLPASVLGESLSRPCVCVNNDGVLGVVVVASPNIDGSLGETQILAFGGG